VHNKTLQLLTLTTPTISLIHIPYSLLLEGLYCSIVLFLIRVRYSLKFGPDNLYSPSHGNKQQ